MDHSDLARYRLLNQQIASQTYERPGELVARLGALQAQDYASALWSIGLRLPAATEADVERAIADRTIIRTWPMRGTLHFVAAADVRWMLPLLTPRVIARSAGRYRQLELDDATFMRSGALFAAALQGGRQLPRSAMYQVLERGHISTAGQRGIHILGRLAQDGLLCLSARDGKQQTFALLDEWVPPCATLLRDAALAELTRRYFTGHGPATVRDFTWWSGLTVADANVGLDGASAHLVQEAVGGQAYWMSGTMPAATDRVHGVHLLPGFDEYLLGYTDRSAVLDPAYSERVVPGKNGMFLATIVIDGRIAGTWKRTFTQRTVSIAYSPFIPIGEAHERALAEAAARYGRFVERSVTRTAIKAGHIEHGGVPGLQDDWI